MTERILPLFLGFAHVVVSTVVVEMMVKHPLSLLTNNKYTFHWSPACNGVRPARLFRAHYSPRISTFKTNPTVR